jgi:four helix bundle protein
VANTYRDLLAWQKAKDLAVRVYKATETFPKSEQFGITSQIRRAAVSVASNIAEGQGRGSKPDFVKFLCVARGSLLELQTQLEIAKELEFVGEAAYTELMQLSFAELGLLNRLMQSLAPKQVACSAK